LHEEVIYHAERLLDKKGAKILDRRAFKDRLLQCDPDVYFEWEDVIRKGNTKTHVKRRGVIEVETNATLDSKTLKRRQYEDTLVNTTLFIFDLSEMEEGRWKDWTYIADWVEKRLPI
jgi:hypothetical protein